MSTLKVELVRFPCDSNTERQGNIRIATTVPTTTASIGSGLCRYNAWASDVSQNAWLDMKRLAALSSTARENLAGQLGDLGRQWAKSPDRPRPEQSVLRRWEHVLDDWIADPSLPLVIRESRRRGERATCSNGREVVFSDNSPANWSFGLALAGEVPDIRSWTSSSLLDSVPLTFLTKGPAAKRDLNKSGWKICHIEPVSDRKRIRIEASPIDRLEAAFRRLLSPGNMFLIPKAISGAGELPELVEAVAVFERSARGFTIVD